MMFLSPFEERRQRLLAEPLRQDLGAYIEKNVALYDLLTPDEQAKIRRFVSVFIAEKYWEGCAGLTVTDEMRATIAAQAGLLVLGYDGFYFDHLRTVLVYPGGYLATDHTGDEDAVHHRLGEAHHKGPVVLSWWDALWDGRRLGHSNLVLHELAHKLTELEDWSTGTPPHTDADVAGGWEQVMAREYRRHFRATRAGRRTLLDPYGAESRAEFFAVATECFFLQPVELHRVRPRLYEVLARWYRQDPRERPYPQSETPASARADKEYLRHAIAECSAMIRLQPDDAEAYAARGELYSEVGECDKALKDFEQVLKITPNDADALCDRADAHRERGDGDLALADYEKALFFDSQCVRAYFGRGSLRLLDDAPADAIADFTKAVRLDPTYEEAYRARGEAFAALGDAVRAQKDIARADRLATEI